MGPKKSKKVAPADGGKKGGKKGSTKKVVPVAAAATAPPAPAPAPASPPARRHPEPAGLPPLPTDPLGTRAVWVDGATGARTWPPRRSARLFETDRVRDAERRRAMEGHRRRVRRLRVQGDFDACARSRRRPPRWRRRPAMQEAKGAAGTTSTASGTRPRRALRLGLRPDFDGSTRSRSRRTRRPASSRDAQPLVLAENPRRRRLARGRDSARSGALLPSGTAGPRTSGANGRFDVASRPPCAGRGPRPTMAYMRCAAVA